MIVDGLSDLKHIQFAAAENGLQFLIGDDLALVLGVLEFVALYVSPDTFRNFAARSGSDPTILASCSVGRIGFMSAGFVFVFPAVLGVVPS